MSNPYIAPQSNSTASVPYVDFAKVPIIWLQVSCLALIGGPISYATFVLYSSAPSRMALRWSELFSVEYWGYSLQIFLASYFIPWVVCKIGVARLRRSGKLNTQRLFDLFQAQLLAGILLLLSVVFYGVFWFSGSDHNTGWSNLAFLLLAALFEGLIIARFPTRNRLEKWWKRQHAWEIQPTA